MTQEHEKVDLETNLLRARPATCFPIRDSFILSPVSAYARRLSRLCQDDRGSRRSSGFGHWMLEGLGLNTPPTEVA